MEIADIFSSLINTGPAGAAFAVLLWINYNMGKKLVDTIERNSGKLGEITQTMQTFMHDYKK